MKPKIINASELQRNGLKDIYNSIEEYGKVYMVNQRNDKTLIIKAVDDDYDMLAHIIKSIRTVKGRLQKEYGITKIGVFGSFVRGEATKASDLDIVVDLIPKEFGKWDEIEEIISSVTKHKNVDLVPYNQLRPLVKEEVDKEVIYV